MIMDIGLQKKDRKLVCESLSRVLSDTFMLYVKTQGFHWNVTGPSFHMFHTLFQTQYQELLNALDTLAERIRALGFPTPATYQEYAHLTAIKEEQGSLDAIDMIKRLILDHELLVRRCAEVVHVAESVHDIATTDMIVKRIHYHSHQAWFLRSHLE